ncbi:hypothetical protein [Dactylosporangium darangshiense]|uniref:hypothetical protein n=1 Tax=Dactylosporangium darangshiense TaxID=579108 RepID=UPI0031E869D5
MLAVLIARAGGTIDIGNGELYDAMLPEGGQAERVRVEELVDGLRLTLVPPPAQP